MDALKEELEQVKAEAEASSKKSRMNERRLQKLVQVRRSLTLNFSTLFAYCFM